MANVRTYVIKNDRVRDPEIHYTLVPKKAEPEPTDGRKLMTRVCHLFSNEYLRILLAEFIGTFVLLAIGDGTVAQVVLDSHKKTSKSGITQINLGWGIAVKCGQLGLINHIISLGEPILVHPLFLIKTVMMGVYVSGGVSGGHINPAVTVAMAIFKKLSWRKVPFYLIGQYLGAFMGAAGVYLCYYDAFNYFDGGRRFTTPHENSTAGVFSTFPQEHVSTLQGFIDQIFATGLLVLLATAISDKRNMDVPNGFAPFVTGFIVTALTAAYGYNCGAALNPARDLSPRTFTAMAGWGTTVFSFRNYNWFWVPIIGPHIGAILGLGLYIICIELHWPPVGPVKKCQCSENNVCFEPRA